MKNKLLILLLTITTILSLTVFFTGCADNESENQSDDTLLLEKIRQSYVDAGYDATLSGDDESYFSGTELIYKALEYKIKYAANADTATVIYIIEVPTEAGHNQIKKGYPEHKTNGLFMVAFVSGTADYLPFDKAMT